MQLTSISATGDKGTYKAQDSVFGVAANPALIAQAIHVYRHNQRQGTSKVKTRAEVARTRKKWFKQKGTGNARHGARTPSLFVGGGVAHGPNGSQNWSRSLAKVMMHQALKVALSAQAKNVVICDSLERLDGKTGAAMKMLKKVVPGSSRILVVLPQTEAKIVRGFQNVTSVLTTTAARLNVYQVAAADTILTTTSAIKALEARLLETEVKA